MLSDTHPNKLALKRKLDGLLNSNRPATSPSKYAAAIDTNPCHTLAAMCRRQRYVNRQLWAGWVASEHLFA